MKNKDGRKFRRMIGVPRKSQSIYDNLGHPFDIKNKKVIFIGKNEKAYSLTKGKKYTLLNADMLKKNDVRDDVLYNKTPEKEKVYYHYFQKEDYFITIINDRGHKRQYSHLMFKLAEA